jgi:hypothetical protein
MRGAAADAGASYRVAVTPTRTPAKTPPAVEGAPKPGIDGFDFEDVEHIVPEDDPDTALCGVDQTDVPWNQGFPPCAACVEVMQHQAGRGNLN